MKRTMILATSLLLTGTLWAQEEIFSEAGEFAASGVSSSNRHVIPVEAGMTVEVIVIGDGVDTTLNATLPDGEQIYNDDYESLNAGFARTMASGGEIVVQAAPLSSGQTGSYRVVARTLAPPSRIDVGQTVEGRLADGSGGGDRYELSGAEGTRVAIDLKSYDFDAYLTVIDSQGNETTDDDGGDEGYNSRLHYQFDDDETITVIASSLSSASGRYQLIVTELSSEVAASHRGRLTGDSPRGYDGTRFEHHEIDGQAGEILTIRLDSNDFDPVLYVSSPDGSNLARDDDGGGGNNSLAIVTLPVNGTYSIYVTGFGEGQGDYELTIYR